MLQFKCRLAISLEISTIKFITKKKRIVFLVSNSAYYTSISILYKKKLPFLVHKLTSPFMIHR